MTYSTYNISKECGISTRQLYYWESIGMIRPQYENFGTRQFRRYSAGDIRMLKQIKAMLDEGYTLQAVKKRLERELEAAADRNFPAPLLQEDHS